MHFDAQTYWEDRHGSHRGSLKAVGHRHLSDEANSRQYEIKRTRIIEMILRHTADTYGRTMLDAGCGIGLLTRAYAELGFDVVGVDFAPTAIRRAQATGVNARFIVSPLSRLRLRERFDVITIVDVLMHIVDEREWRDTLSSLARHLKPDGVLIILDHLAARSDEQAEHCRPRSLTAYVTAFAELGLYVVDHERLKLLYEGSTKDLLAVRHAR